MIEKNIPHPYGDGFYSARGGISKYPFREMEPGDSAFFPGEGTTPPNVHAYQAAKTIQKHDKRYLFSARRCVVDGVNGLRIWRIK